jgi:activator of 2-hydroxyglutaryl-CoA dehydratase
VTFTGGVTKNRAMVQTLNKRLGVTVNVGGESHFMGALGAALFGLDRIEAARAPAQAAPVSGGAA